MFDPNPGLKLAVGGNTFEFLEHPNAPGCAFGAEGGIGTVYQVRDLGSRRFHAWKVMREKFQSPDLGPICDRLQKLSSIPGLAAAQREFVSKAKHSNIVRAHPELACSILMPWIQGQTWFDTLMRKKPLKRGEGIRLALGISSVLASLEKDQLAHTDISPGNVMFNLATGEVQLVDLEGVFRHDFPSPPVRICGTPGYQHLEAEQGLWSPEADRFAGAILMTEVLMWAEGSMMPLLGGESLFDSDELQRPRNAKYRQVESILRKMNSGLADLLGQAWNSRTLKQCPPLEQWHQRMQELSAQEGLAQQAPVANPQWNCPISPVQGWSGKVVLTPDPVTNPVTGFSGQEKAAPVQPADPVIGWQSVLPKPDKPKT